MHSVCTQLADSIHRVAEFDSGENEALRRDVRLLGELLGQTVAAQHGAAQLQLIEEVRAIAKRAQLGEADATRQLIDKLSTLSAERLLRLARAFTLFLNLANIAEQHHQIRQRRQTLCTADANGALPQSVIDAELSRLRAAGISRAQLLAQVERLSINIVLTAHPTEVVRRSVSAKFLRIARLLGEQDRADLSGLERAQIITALHRAIGEVWATDEIRRRRPTPLDEAKMSLVTVEHSLWDAVPNVLRELDAALVRNAGARLGRIAPVQFGSWMGGDRDGNPNTTPQMTRRVCILNKLKAAQLFCNDIDELRRDLSMRSASPTLRAQSAMLPNRIAHCSNKLSPNLTQPSRIMRGCLPMARCATVSTLRLIRTLMRVRMLMLTFIVSVPSMPTATVTVTVTVTTTPSIIAANNCAHR